MAMVEKLPHAQPTPAAKLRETIVHHVVEHIRRGAWPVDHRLPTQAELAEQFGTSRSNVNQALKRLEKEGVVRQYRRQGTFVTSVDAAQRAPRPEPLARPRRDCAHILSPSFAEPGSRAHSRRAYHWNEAAMAQLESLINAAGLQSQHRTMPDHPTPDAFGEYVAELNKSGSRALVILLDFTAGQSTATESVPGLRPYVEALMNYHGRVCWLNRSGAPLTNWPYDAVCLSPSSEGIAVGRYLSEQNVSRVVYFGLEGARSSRLRIEGLEMALHHAPQSIEAEPHWHATPVEMDRDMARVLDEIASRGDRPTLVARGDHSAARLLDLAQERGVRCPDAFNLISFDNDDRFRDYNITTVAPPANQLGEAIGQLVCDQVRRPSNAAIHMTLKSVIVERGTFAQADPK